MDGDIISIKKHQQIIKSVLKIYKIITSGIFCDVSY